MKAEAALPYLKAIAGFLGPALIAVAYAILPISEGGKWWVITSSEWGLIFTAALGTSGLVYSIPNKDPKAKHQDESVQPPKR